MLSSPAPVDPLACSAAAPARVRTTALHDAMAALRSRWWVVVVVVAAALAATAAA